MNVAIKKTPDNIVVQDSLLISIKRNIIFLYLDKGYAFQEIENVLSRKDIYYILFDVEGNNQQ